MSIRIASTADAPSVAKIISRANQAVAQQFGLTRENTPKHPSFCTTDWVVDDLKRNAQYFIYETAGKAVGCVAYENAEKDLAFLNRLAVLPEFQGRGIGEKLVSHLFDHARTRHKKRISIGIIAANDLLKNWYETLGFTPFETKTFNHLPFDVLLMQCLLNDLKGGHLARVTNRKESSMETPKKVLVSRQFPEIGISLLEQAGFELTLWSKDRPMYPSELIGLSLNHQALLCTVSEMINKEFLEQCSHLEIISQFAVGYDNIDVAEATRLKIPIGFTPDVMSEATADIAFGLMIATARKMFFLHKTILKGDWGYFKPRGNLGMELRGKTLGVFGLGRIGMKMARLCKDAYGMEVIYHNRQPNPVAEKSLNADRVSFEELLTRSDVLSVHSVLSPETCGLFNAEIFKQMKSTAIFINTARGAIHNETDLIEALASQQIWGAGLDVTNPEPMAKDNPLLSMENVCVLPHVGSGTMEARNGMSRLAAENIIEFYKTGTPPHVVNPIVLEKEKTPCTHQK
jgi:glyoxylate reductase